MSCCICGSSFKYWSKKCIDKHMEDHVTYGLVNLPYKCLYCNKSINTMKTAVCHIRRHNGTQRFKCIICSYSSDRSYDLKVHMRSHTGEKKYECDQCGVSFCRNSELTRHKKIHEGVVLKCPDCENTYTRMDALKRHHYYWHTKEGNARMVRKEESVRKELESNCISFDPQTHVSFSCFRADTTRAFIDFTVPKEWGYFLIEVDEEQHSDYGVACEFKRMLDIQSALLSSGYTGRCVFVRYNPDDFSIDKKKMKVCRERRLRELIMFINTYTPSKLLEIHYLFYDILNSCIKIKGDSDFPGNLSQICSWFPTKVDDLGNFPE